MALALTMAAVLGTSTVATTSSASAQVHFGKTTVAAPMLGFILSIPSDTNFVTATVAAAAGVVAAVTAVAAVAANAAAQRASSSSSSSQSSSSSSSTGGSDFAPVPSIRATDFD